MIFQKTLKGIANLSDAEAEDMVKNYGILSNWWRKKISINNSEIADELTEINLMHHLNEYNKPLPASHKWSSLGATYGDVSAFISTSSGAIQRSSSANVIFPSFITALKFATKKYKTSGYIFHCYVVTLGKQSIPFQSFAEEVRELHIYRDFMPYHHQGEITAKISIPSINIEKAEKYDGPRALRELKSGKIPSPIKTIINPNYQDPSNYSNVRDFI
jgi:hypothetical protein